VSKVNYLMAALNGVSPKDKRLGEAALYFYHAEVPVNDANQYLKTLASKLK
jgi:hypothetical protein